MINAFSFANPVDAHESMCKKLMMGNSLYERDWTHGTEVGLHNVALHCESIEFDYNLKKLWIPRTRWTTMVRQYIDPLALDDALDKVEERMSGKYSGKKGRGITILRTEEHTPEIPSAYDTNDPAIVELKTRMVQGKGTGRNVRRRWGSCMLNMSFRANPIPTVSLHSRTTYFGYLALVDMAIAAQFANECSMIVGIPLKNVEFVWTLDLAQFHGFRSLAWALSNEDIRNQMTEDVDNRKSLSAKMVDGNQPGYRKALDGYGRILQSDRANVLYGDESFSSFARIRRRFHTEVYGTEYANQFRGGTRIRGGQKAFPPLPDTWLSKLDFSCLPPRK